MKTKLQFVFLCFFIFTTTAFAQQEARKFDSMGQVNCEDAKARLDNWAIELQNNPNTKGYLIFYGGRRYSNYVYDKKKKQYVTVELSPKQGEAGARISPWKPYLTDNRGIDASRIEVIDGGYREEPTIELWVVPTGAKPPTPKPTLSKKEIRFRKGRIKRGDIPTFGC
ncbi:MAG TPA: hypothetical protein VM095_12665 [Pyrinomonadaceae bacterium]|nr:hypothetical protein [Pyrinomonadaceae bacterium]